MPFLTLLFGYSLCTTIVLCFMLKQNHQYRKWYRLFLINPDSPTRIKRFFIELNPVWQRFYPLLEGLKKHRGRPPTDYRFQFRWLIWWKFFGPKILQQAIRLFNQSAFLQRLLQAPQKAYSREIFQSFRQKLGTGLLQRLQEELIQQFETQGLLDWKTLIIDSLPVCSFLNTTKCLKIPTINYTHLKQFLATISLESILEKLKVRPSQRLKVKTKLLALLVKGVWDLPSWNRCWKVLYGKPAQKAGIQLPYQYKSAESLQNVQKLLGQVPSPRTLEQLLVPAAVTTLVQLGLKPTSWHPQTLDALNGCWHRPHRWRDRGISLFYCAAKNVYFYGRGALLVVLPHLELPLMIRLTDKYKQSQKSLLPFFDTLHRVYGRFLHGVTLLGDSEFGLSEVHQALQHRFQGKALVPKYKTNEAPPELTKDLQNLRKLVERVIGRLVINWQLETPRHLGESYAGFHLQLCILCDLLQVTFNLQLGNSAHPHALNIIRG